MRADLTRLTRYQRQLVELDSQGLDVREIATRVGRVLHNVRHALERAKRRMAHASMGMSPNERARIRAEEHNANAGGHCERCGLRGEHECIPPNYWHAVRRNDPPVW